MNVQRLSVSLAVATLGLMAACSGPTDDKTGAVNKPTEAPIPAAHSGVGVQAQPPCLLPEYNLETVEAGPKTKEQAKLSTALIAKMVRQNPRLPPLFKAYNKYWQLFALDTVRCHEFMLVSYLYRHEDCCSDVYYVTFSPDGHTVIDWATIANTGADGMWAATATMSTQQARLRVTTVEEDSEDDGQPGFQDSVVVDYSVTPQGNFVRARVDSVRTTQTAQN